MCGFWLGFTSAVALFPFGASGHQCPLPKVANNGRLRPQRGQLAAVAGVVEPSGAAVMSGTRRIEVLPMSRAGIRVDSNAVFRAYLSDGGLVTLKRTSRLLKLNAEEVGRFGDDGLRLTPNPRIPVLVVESGDSRVYHVVGGAAPVIRTRRVPASPSHVDLGALAPLVADLASRATVLWRAGGETGSLAGCTVVGHVLDVSGIAKAQEAGVGAPDPAVRVRRDRDQIVGIVQGLVREAERAGPGSTDRRRQLVVDLEAALPAACRDHDLWSVFSVKGVEDVDNLLDAIRRRTKGSSIWDGGSLGRALQALASLDRARAGGHVAPMDRRRAVAFLLEWDLPEHPGEWILAILASLDRLEMSATDRRTGDAPPGVPVEITIAVPGVGRVAVFHVAP